jgi:hypothetical protein
MTLAFRDRGAAGVVTCPDHVVVPIASGPLLTKIHQGFGELSCRPPSVSPSEGPDLGERRATGLLPRLAGVFRVRAGARGPAAVGPATIARSLPIGAPADRPGTPCPSVPQDRRRDRRRSPTGRIRRTGSRCSPAPRASFAETAGGVTIRGSCGRCCERGVIRPARSERFAYVTPGTGLKTVRRARGFGGSGASRSVRRFESFRSRGRKVCRCRWVARALIRGSRRRPQRSCGAAPQDEPACSRSMGCATVGRRRFGWRRFERHPSLEGAPLSTTPAACAASSTVFVRRGGQSGFRAGLWTHRSHLARQSRSLPAVAVRL